MKEGRAPSIWLVPSGDGHRVIQSTIDRFSFTYNGPRFGVHLTLLGGLEGKPDALAFFAEELAAQLPPLELTLGAAQWGDSYFQRLYLPVTLDEPLKEARRAAVELFNAPNERWTPHISLLYAEPDSALRGSPMAAPAAPVAVSALHLVNTVGPVNQWKTVARFNLTGFT